MGLSIVNNSIWLIDGTLIGTTTPGQSGPGSNNNKEILHTSLSDAV